MSVKVAVVGASGYAARELFRLLARHPHVELVAACSRESERPFVADLHPTLRTIVSLQCEPFEAESLAKRVTCAFLALPHGAAVSAAAPLLAKGVRVIDLSADYRLRDPNVYAQWYGASHQDVDNLKHAVYGQPEFFAEEIAAAKLIANPGCYPSSAQLGLAPLVAAELIERDGIVVDSKSGVSGAGRSPKPNLHYPECNEAISAYSIGTHRHTPEIEQLLTDLAGSPVTVSFTPHLTPMDRGILSTIYARPKRPTPQKALVETYRDYYANKPFIRVVDELPSTKDVSGTNFCDIAVRVTPHYIVVVSCLDNLLKGAAGVAVQNFNLMFGFPETTALLG
jgi:N-acetyl-gamma-glutamyl-phosphate reductase